MIEVRRYRTAQGRVPYAEWLAGLDESTAARVTAYVRRMRLGNFGDSAPVGDGVSELKINFGPGYRVYYLRGGDGVVLLLGGAKGSQGRDIREARHYAVDYRRKP